jgi:hypothetical protein
MPRKGITAMQQNVCVQKQTLKVEATKAETDKHKLYPKFFHWPQAWMLPKLEQEIAEFVCLKR